jgi:hypothetical protein
VQVRGLLGEGSVGRLAASAVIIAGLIIALNIYLLYNTASGTV